jgi:hypothetical protein
MPLPMSHFQEGVRSACFNLADIEDPCSKLQGIFDRQGITNYSNRSLTPQQATGE